MQIAFFSKRIFSFGVLLLCLIFALMQFYLSSHTMFTPDELWVAHSVYSKYRLYLPYQDFVPYKTVLGYYLFLIPLSLTKDPVTGLIYLKIFLTCINTLFMLVCAWLSTRFFSYTAILLSLALLISTNFFVNFSADIRVDLIAYWCCLISVLFLLGKRNIYAGIILGLAFCISQKAIWYGLASDIALIMVWMLFDRKQKNILPIIGFNLSFISVIAIYIGIASYISNFSNVIDSVFYQAAIIYQINIYQVGNNYMLSSIVKNNLFYLAFWVLSALSLLTYHSREDFRRRVFIITFAWSAMFFLIIYKQPFTYYAIAVLPALFLLYTDFFCWINSLLTKKMAPSLSYRFSIYVFTVSFLLLVLIKIEFLILPAKLTMISISLLLCIPMLLFISVRSNISDQNKSACHLSLMIIYLIIITCGIFIPQIQNTKLFKKTGYAYQQLAIKTLNELVADDSTYIAGVDLLYNKNQVISGNSYLEQNLLFLNDPNPKLKKLMLPALDLNPNISIEKMIVSIKENPVKVFVNCSFMLRLPQLMDFLTSQYAYLWGNIYVYGPKIAQGTQSIKFKFSGKYTLESESPILLNGKKVLSNTQVVLQADQIYQSIAKTPYRFILLPKDLKPLPKKYQAENTERLFSECTELYINNKRRCVYFQILPERKKS